MFELTIEQVCDELLNYAQRHPVERYRCQAIAYQLKLENRGYINMKSTMVFDELTLDMALANLMDWMGSRL